MNLNWGIDLGGTKIEGVICTPDPEGKAIVRRRIATESEQGYSHIISRIVLLVRQLQDESGISPARLGIGTPGVRDPLLGVMKNCNTVCLNGTHLQEDIEGALGIPVTLANDANCFALAESRYGAARDARVVFGVILGTGVGGGIVVDGKVLGGAQGIAGEWGHVTCDPDGPQCYCGRRGCIESFLAGPALESFYFERSGERRRVSEIVARAASDLPAQETLARMLSVFGRGLATVINILDPDVIVLGGGLSNLDILYSEGCAAVEREVFNHSLHTRIVKNQLGDSAGVFGAALL